MSFPRRPFSRRHGLRPRTQITDPTELPDSARTALIRFIDERRERLFSGAYSLEPALRDAVGLLSDGPGDIRGIRSLVNEVEWWQFYDLCEELVRQSRSQEEAIEAVEEILTGEGLPYQMTPEGLRWRLDEPSVEAIEEAETFLVTDERFKGPAEQWAKARAHLDERPPDAENCIKDAVGALEGTARIILNQPSKTLGQLTQPLAQQLGFHPSLGSAISKLYGYRSDENGIGHGATEPSRGLVLEAEMALLWSAASIVFLVKKQGGTEDE